MTTRLISALLCGGVLAFMAPTALAAKDRKPQKGIDIVPPSYYGPMAARNQKPKFITKDLPAGRTIFDRWGNSPGRAGRNPATGEAIHIR